MSEALRAKKIYIFWSFVPEPWAEAIVWITGRQLPDRSDHWSHMGIIFELQDGSQVYFEALVDQGFVGPKPIKKLLDKTKAGRLAVEHLEFPRHELEYLYETCQKWVGKKTYNRWQLAAMWFFERFGRWTGMHIPKSEDMVVCSEVVSQLIVARYDLRDKERDGHDEVNPNSAWRKRLLDNPMMIGISYWIKNCEFSIRRRSTYEKV